MGNVGPVVREGKGIILQAYQSSEFPTPDLKFIVQLEPADLPKNRASLYLPVALAILIEFYMSPQELKMDGEDGVAKDWLEALQRERARIQGLRKLQERNYLMIGEVNIKGEVMRVDGLLSMLLDAAREEDVIIIPEGNAQEARIWAGSATSKRVEVYPIRSLREAYSVIVGDGGVRTLRARSFPRLKKKVVTTSVNFAEVLGQERAKRALEIAAAGGHHCLLYGPKGEGKSLLAKALPGILPRLDPRVNFGEILEINKVWSAKGWLPDGKIVEQRPFREIGPGISEPALFGGGRGEPRPGEISLAHRGVLLMDELPQFPRGMVERLRAPLQDRKTTVSRTGGAVEFPCNFILIGAMNPCRCSYFGEFECGACGATIESDDGTCGNCGKRNPKHRCTCGVSERAFESLLSGPLEDRIHLKARVYSQRGALGALTKIGKLERSDTIRARVEAARRRQADRFKNVMPEITLNSDVRTPAQIKEFFRLSAAASRTADETKPSGGPVSMRTRVQSILVARTIADLEDTDLVEPVHIEEAKAFARPLSARIELRYQHDRGL